MFNNLINVAKKGGTVNAAIVNVGEIFPMESVHKAVQHNLINPTFVGDESEIKNLAQQTINEVGAESVKDLGKVMPIIMKKLAGKAEGKIVNKIVTELLS